METPDANRKCNWPTRPASTSKSSDDSGTAPIRLSVVIPAYNEEGNVCRLMEQFDCLFSSLPYKSEMIFIDDGSTDKTLAIAKENLRNYPWLKIFNHLENRKLSAALETGFSKANGEIICFYPADLQYHANEIPKMLSMIDSGFDMVTGWRQGDYGIRLIGSFIYNLLSRFLFKVKVHDLNSIKMFRKEVMSCFTYRSGWHSFMVVMAANKGYAIGEVKVKLYPRYSGKTKSNFWRLPIGLLDLLGVKFQLSFSRRPFVFFGTIGLFLMLLGLLTLLYAIYLRFVAKTGFRPILYLVISGLILFTMGFLSELIVSVRDDIIKRIRNPDESST